MGSIDEVCSAPPTPALAAMELSCGDADGEKAECMGDCRAVGALLPLWLVCPLGPALALGSRPRPALLERMSSDRERTCEPEDAERCSIGEGDAPPLPLPPADPPVPTP